MNETRIAPPVSAASGTTVLKPESQPKKIILLDQWYLGDYPLTQFFNVSGNDNIVVLGQVYGHPDPKNKDGEIITTSRLLKYVGEAFVVDAKTESREFFRENLTNLANRRFVVSASNYKLPDPGKPYLAPVFKTASGSLYGLLDALPEYLNAFPLSPFQIRCAVPLEP